MTKIAAKGTHIQKSISAVFTTIAQVTNISGPSAEVQTGDVTSLDGGVGMEFATTGYVNGGEVTFTLWLDPVATTLQAITDDLTTPATSSWKLKFSDSATTEWAFSAIVTGVSPTAEVNGHLTADVTLKVTGLPTWPT